MEQIIKFSISNYLQLCVEAGFSQIQSHIMIYSPEFGGSFCQGSAREYDPQLCNTNVSMLLYTV